MIRCAAYFKRIYRHTLTGQSHDPLFGKKTGTRISGKLTSDERERPINPPVMSDRALRLAGMKAY
jgi:hypothetical protein